MTTTYMLPDLPAREYHAGPEASVGRLKAMKRSPAHARHAMDNPSEPTPAMSFGTAWHSAFFEPAKFAAEYATDHDAHPATSRAKLLDTILAGDPLAWLGTVTPIPDDISLKTKEGKALAAEIEAEGRTPIAQSEFEWISTWIPRLQGRQIIRQDDLTRIQAMNASANAHPITRILLDPARGGMAEPSIFDEDPATGIMVRVRPDLLIPPCDMFPHGFILDGKTTGDASAAEFGRTAWNLDYPLQAALYSRLVQRLFRTAQRPPFAWLAIERDAPHACAYYTASAELIAYGDAEADRLLAQFAECTRTGIWPGYDPAIAHLTLPAWAQKAVNGNDDEVESIAYA